MSIEKQTKLSELRETGDEKLPSTSLFVVDVVQNSVDEKTATGYETKTVTFEQLKQSLYTGLKLQKITDDLKYLNEVSEVPSSFIRIKNAPPEKIPVISAFYDKKNILIGKPETYNMFVEISNFLTSTTIDNISAVESPWIRTENISMEENNDDGAEDHVASQSLFANSFENFPSSDVISRENIRSSLDEPISSGYVAAQSLITNISSIFILTGDVTSEMGESDVLVASQSMVGALSVSLSDIFPISNITGVLGQSTQNASSQKLASDIFRKISREYALKIPVSSFLSSSQIIDEYGDVSDLVVTQRLMTDISTICEGILADTSAISGNDGEVYYTPLSTENAPLRWFGTKNILVCEISNDFIKTMNGIEVPLNKTIMDFSGYPVSVYSYSGSTWTVDTTISAIPENSIGTLSKNPYTNKLFYITEHTAVKVSDCNDILSVQYRSNIPISVFFHETIGQNRISAHENGYSDEPLGMATPGNIFEIQSGEEILGWDTNPDAKTPQYTAGDPILEISSIHLYQIWPKITVTFDANGGVFAND